MSYTDEKISSQNCFSLFQDCLYHHPVHKISFIAQDVQDSRAFGYIYGSPENGHRFFGIKTEKAAGQVSELQHDNFNMLARDTYICVSGCCGNEGFVPSRLRVEKEANWRCQIEHQWIQGWTAICSKVKGKSQQWRHNIFVGKVDMKGGIMVMTAFYDKDQT